jgi:hypothetical protein
MRFRNNLNHVRWISKYKKCIGKPNILQVFGSNKPKELNRIDTIGYGHLYFSPPIYLSTQVNNFNDISVTGVGRM